MGSPPPFLGRRPPQGDTEVVAAICALESARVARLTAHGSAVFFRTVIRLSRLAALWLLIAWLPTAVHCKLEAAGLLEPPRFDEGSACCAKDKTPQTLDACPVLDRYVFKAAHELSPLPPPTAIAEIERDSETFGCDTAARIESARHGGDDRWVRRHLMRGAAPCPRAPCAAV